MYKKLAYLAVFAVSNFCPSLFCATDSFISTFVANQLKIKEPVLDLNELKALSGLNSFHDFKRKIKRALLATPNMVHVPNVQLEALIDNSMALQVVADDRFCTKIQEICCDLSKNCEKLSSNNLKDSIKHAILSKEQLGEGRYLFLGACLDMNCPFSRVSSSERGLKIDFFVFERCQEILQGNNNEISIVEFASGRAFFAFKLLSMLLLLRPTLNITLTLIDPIWSDEHFCKTEDRVYSVLQNKLAKRTKQFLPAYFNAVFPKARVKINFFDSVSTIELLLEKQKAKLFGLEKPIDMLFGIDFGEQGSISDGFYFCKFLLSKKNTASQKLIRLAFYKMYSVFDSEIKIIIDSPGISLEELSGLNLKYPTLINKNPDYGEVNH